MQWIKEQGTIQSNKRIIKILEDMFKSKTALLTIILTLLLGAVQSFACEIDFEVQGKKKEKYEVGDIVVVKVTVTYTHRVCPEGIEKTKFEGDGMKILKATKWKETEPNVWVRKLQVKVTGNESGELELSAVRTCDKEGGHGTITLASTPVEKAEAKTEEDKS